jgi:hypothetical protein
MSWEWVGGGGGGGQRFKLRLCLLKYCVYEENIH